MQLLLCNVMELMECIANTSIQEFKYTLEHSFEIS